jgi:hypothetical protein
MTESKQRIAVYIDADNVSPEWTASVFDLLASRWDAYLRRAYGVNLSSQKSVFRSCGILAVEVFPNTKGKDAADHALIIDAMKELYRGYADAICLVSGDGDFTRLAQAWREEGKSVLAYGPAHTPVALRSACTEFGLLGQEKVYQQVCAKATIVQGVECITGDKVILKELLSIVEGMTERTETATVGNLSTLVRKRNPGFSPGRYRARTLTKLLRRLEAFELDALENQNGEISDYKVRIRPALARAKVHNPVRLASEGGGGDDAVGLQFLGAEGVVTLEIERDASQYAVRS